MDQPQRHPWAAPLRDALAVRPDSAAMARALGLIYLAGPTAAVITVLLPHPAELNETGIIVLCAAAYAVVPLLFGFWGRMPVWLIAALIGFANVLVTLAVWFGGETTSIYGYFYLWATPLAFAFFSLAHALAQTAFAGALYAAVLVVLDKGDGGEAGRWLLAMGSVAVTGLLVRAISTALRDESERLERERRLRALEINDSIVQGLVLAKAAGEQGLAEQSNDAVADTLHRAQEIIGDLLGEGPVEAGALRRSEAATPGKRPPPG